MEEGWGGRCDVCDVCAVQVCGVHKWLCAVLQSVNQLVLYSGKSVTYMLRGVRRVR